MRVFEQNVKVFYKDVFDWQVVRVVCQSEDWSVGLVFFMRGGQSSGGVKGMIGSVIDNCLRISSFFKEGGH